jgi:cyclophilin family peptidyl-prolyl cis-trans isomerase
MKKILFAIIALMVTTLQSVKAEEKMTEKFEYVTISTDHGDITMRLLPEFAPITVASIKERVSEGFYDGLFFHRVIPGFVAQGGDPALSGRPDVDYTLPPEFSREIKHQKGSVAMARTSDPHSASTQFYIAYDNIPHLDAQYTIFAEVVDGMPAAFKLEEGDKMNKVFMNPDYK